MISTFLTKALLILASGFGIAGLCLWLHEHGVCPIKAFKRASRSLSLLGLCALALWAAPLIQYGSTSESVKCKMSKCKVEVIT